ncbi:TKL family protein kinase [Histomonas meleagridis]|uniref:TKL family protein kinase n=1 Tax=Histomonas meleagridis TaxID=135588 RepID=UPI0035597923|nr:TKL family protein kinase [Histomonas meleagridis]KAH0803228.1 TKL family protein kinase [Histomonas meleagridis]
MHCGLQSFQWYAIDLLGCFNNIPPEEYIFGAIYSAARYSSHGTLALYNFISISPQHANFLTRFSDWMLIPLPTIIDTYKLLVLLYIYPNIRATLSHTKEFPRLLRKIIQIHDNKIFVTIGSLLKRSIVDPRLFAQLESSGFFKEYFEYVQNSESSSVLSSALVTCSFLADIEFSNAYLLCLQRFANCAKGKSNLKNYAIQVIVALSKHKEARSMLRSSGLMEMFQEMKGEYDNLAQQFFENMEKD